MSIHVFLETWSRRVLRRRKPRPPTVVLSRMPVHPSHDTRNVVVAMTVFDEFSSSPDMRADSTRLATRADTNNANGLPPALARLTFHHRTRPLLPPWAGSSARFHDPHRLHHVAVHRRRKTSIAFATRTSSDTVVWSTVVRFLRELELGSFEYGGPWLAGQE
ncbi:hypothetical protein C8F01DRAFT_1253953 [Mycena amicta]|nr:hypothetical protein C8F01DRAFT_1253953 [Mycena amicta]